MKVTLLIFSDDRRAIERVKNRIIPSLNMEFLKRNVRVGEIKYSEEHQSYNCYINIIVGKELGSTVIPLGFYDTKPSIVLKEAKE